MDPFRVKWDGRALNPASWHDAECAGGMAQGVEYTVKPTRPRSSPQNSCYWATLHKVVNSTALGDRYPTKRHLHSALLMAAGYVEPVARFSGEPVLVPNSTAFHAMKQDEFKNYMDRAMTLLAQEIGSDPMELV